MVDEDEDESLEEDFPEEEQEDEDDGDLLTDHAIAKNPTARTQKPQLPVMQQPKPAVQPRQSDVKTRYVERELNLSLINDKLNFIITRLEEIKQLFSK